jgi:hypothetical protein
LRFVDVEHANAAITKPQNEPVSGYGLLVIEDYSPQELKDSDGSSVLELEKALIDKEAYGFLSDLAQHCYEGYVVVVVTTKCKSTLRLIHHGINGGHKAMAAPFTTIHAGMEAMSSKIEMPRDHVGMGWDQTSRLELFSKKYGQWTTTAEGMVKAEDLAATQESIQDCCEILYFGNNSHCAKIYPRPCDYWNNWFVDSFLRLFKFQPACSYSTVDDTDIEMGKTEYGVMA